MHSGKLTRVLLVSCTVLLLTLTYLSSLDRQTQKHIQQRISRAMRIEVDGDPIPSAEEEIREIREQEEQAESDKVNQIVKIELPTIFNISHGNLDQTLFSLSQLLHQDSDEHCGVEVAPKVSLYREFMVIRNFVVASEESCSTPYLVTYTTHAEFFFLMDNLPHLLNRWNGPISIAIYAPGSDFYKAVRRIVYLRECLQGVSEIIRKFANFHIFFDQKHLPGQREMGELIRKLGDNGVGGYCDTLLTDTHVPVPNYRESHSLTYPINVARNLAKEMATTRFILPSDIELYPNPGLLQDFTWMIEKSDREGSHPYSHSPKNLYVLPIFEIDKHFNFSELPQDKEELVMLLENDKAVPFHSKICSHCHRIPGYEKWMKLPYEPGMDMGVFMVASRTGQYKHWEPIYIAEKGGVVDYDERLSWEGMKDKMTQGYILCVLGYKMHILTSGFLLHTPGIKTRKEVFSENRKVLIAKQNKLIRDIVLPEMKKVYGERDQCEV